MSERVIPPEAPVSEPVTMINAFTVPPHESDHFLELWKDNARALAGQPGFRGLTLYRSLISHAELRFINVALWESGKALEQAHANPWWQAAVQRLLADPGLHVTARPGVYQVEVEVQQGGTIA